MALTYSDLLEKTLRLLTPTQVEQTIQLTASYTAGSGTMTVDANAPGYAAAGRPGAILSSGQGATPQLWQVQRDIGSGVLQVIGGFQGSTDTNVTGSCTDPKASLVVRPKFSRFDIGVAINDELYGISADGWLGQQVQTNITYVPAFMGYPLPATFDTASSRILEISYAEPVPTHRNPLIRRGEYRVLRNQDSAQFANGSGLVIYKMAWAGLPMRVQFIAPFAPLVGLTDGVTAVAGVPPNQIDLIAWGAALRLAPDREIQRNTMATQPDPRKAAEVPPNAIQNSTIGLQRRYDARLNDEKKRLFRTFPECEGW